MLSTIDVRDGPDPNRARHRRQRLVLPRPRRGAALAPAQRPDPGREGGRPRVEPARLPRREPLLVVRHGRVDGHTVTPRPIYHADGRSRPTLHPSPAAARQPQRSRSARSRCLRTGARRRTSIDKWIADAAKASLAATARPHSWSTCRTWTTTCSASVPKAQAVRAAHELDVVAGRPRGAAATAATG